MSVSHLTEAGQQLVPEFEGVLLDPNQGDLLLPWSHHELSLVARERFLELHVVADLHSHQFDAECHGALVPGGHVVVPPVISAVYTVTDSWTPLDTLHQLARRHCIVQVRVFQQSLVRHLVSEGHVDRVYPVGGEDELVSVLDVPLHLAQQVVDPWSQVAVLPLASPDLPELSLTILHEGKPPVLTPFSQHQSDIVVLEGALDLHRELSLAVLVDSEEVLALGLDDDLDDHGRLVGAHYRETLILELVMAHAHLDVAELRQEVFELHEEDPVVVFPSHRQLVLHLGVYLTPLLRVIRPPAQPLLVSPGIAQLHQTDWLSPQRYLVSSQERVGVSSRNAHVVDHLTALRVGCSCGHDVVFPLPVQDLLPESIRVAVCPKVLGGCSCQIVQTLSSESGLNLAVSPVDFGPGLLEYHNPEFVPIRPGETGPVGLSTLLHWELVVHRQLFHHALLQNVHEESPCVDAFLESLFQGGPLGTLEHPLHPMGPFSQTRQGAQEVTVPQRPLQDVGWLNRTREYLHLTLLQELGGTLPAVLSETLIVIWVGVVQGLFIGWEGGVVVFLVASQHLSHYSLVRVVASFRLLGTVVVLAHWLLLFHDL